MEIDFQPTIVIQRPRATPDYYIGTEYLPQYDWNPAKVPYGHDIVYAFVADDKIHNDVIHGYIFLKGKNIHKKILISLFKYVPTYNVWLNLSENHFDDVVILISNYNKIIRLYLDNGKTNHSFYKNNSWIYSY